MNAYQRFIRPVAFLFDAETTHKAALKAGETAGRTTAGRYLTGLLYRHDDPTLAVTLGQTTYPSVAGIGAGYDKNGQWIGIAPYLSAGHLELGSVMTYQRDGNEKPRLFRLSDDYALVNRMGLNSNGAVSVASSLDGVHPKIPLNINLDPNLFFAEDDADHGVIESLMLARNMLWEIPYAKVLNISCPNTEDGKSFQEPGKLDMLLSRTGSRKTRRDVYVKFSPDLTNEEFSELLDVCGHHRVAGYVTGNTTVKRHGLVTEPDTVYRVGNGGLSGAPVIERNCEMANIAKKKHPGRFVIGVGGIGCNPYSMPEYDVMRYLLAGADIVQTVTGIPYYGFGVFRRINEKLPQLLEDNGFSSVEDMRKRRSL